MTQNHKPELTVLLIGSGGVASYLLPAMLNAFEVFGYLIDGDRLELHNLDRQLFNEKDIGTNKAVALLDHLGHKADGLTAYPEYFTDSVRDIAGHYFEDMGFDLILVMVDNHPARKAALQLAEEIKVPCLIAANEYSTSQASIQLPSMVGTAADLRNLYPEILTDESGSPLSCQGADAESTPQLAIANQVSAALCNYLIWLWFSEGQVVSEYSNLYEILPIELRSTLGGVEQTTLKDINGNQAHSSR